MKIGIIICTYQRPDGNTLYYLNRCLHSIKNQTYSDYKVFLIGDRYEDNEEFLKFTTIIDTSKIYFENLPYAHERDEYGNDKKALWGYAGTYATNYAMDLCMQQDIDFVTFLNHDDYWHENHLDEIKLANEQFNCDFICTKSTYMNSHLPNINSNEKYVRFLPQPGNVIHSAVCINIKNIPLRYRDLWKSDKIYGAGDADYWQRVSQYMTEWQYIGILINELTCRHDEEGYIKR